MPKMTKTKAVDRSNPEDRDRAIKDVSAEDLDAMVGEAPEITEEIPTESPSPSPDPSPLDRAAVGTILRAGMRAAHGYRNHSPELNSWVKSAAEFVQNHGL
jgi:hypothetical protein